MAEASGRHTACGTRWPGSSWWALVEDWEGGGLVTDILEKA